MNDRRKKPTWLKWPARVGALVALLLLGPFGVLAFGDLDLETHWSAAGRASSGQAPDPGNTPDALIQIYGARAYNWRGALGIGLAWEEGIEFNILGLSAGLDLYDLGLRLPGIGRLTLLSRG